jgi:hypothetical protein
MPETLKILVHIQNIVQQNTTIRCSALNVQPVYVQNYLTVVWYRTLAGAGVLRLVVTTIKIILGSYCQCRIPT